MISSPSGRSTFIRRWSTCVPTGAAPPPVSRTPAALRSSTVPSSAMSTTPSAIAPSTRVSVSAWSEAPERAATRSAVSRRRSAASSASTIVSPITNPTHSWVTEAVSRGSPNGTKPGRSSTEATTTVVANDTAWRLAPRGLSRRPAHTLVASTTKDSGQPVRGAEHQQHQQPGQQVQHAQLHAPAVLRAAPRVGAHGGVRATGPAGQPVVAGQERHRHDQDDAGEVAHRELGAAARVAGEQRSPGDLDRDQRRQHARDHPGEEDERHVAPGAQRRTVRGRPRSPQPWGGEGQRQAEHQADRHREEGEVQGEDQGHPGQVVDQHRQREEQGRVHREGAAPPEQGEPDRDHPVGRPDQGELAALGHREAPQVGGDEVRRAGHQGHQPARRAPGGGPHPGGPRGLPGGRGPPGSGPGRGRGCDALDGRLAHRQRRRSDRDGPGRALSAGAPGRAHAEDRHPITCRSAVRGGWVLPVDSTASLLTGKSEKTGPGGAGPRTPAGHRVRTA